MNKKKIYDKPTCTVIYLQHPINLLTESSDRPDATDYDDWLG